MTDGQALAVEQLQDVARRAEGDGALEILSIEQEVLRPDTVRAEISIATKQFDRSPAGLPLRPRERLLLHIPPEFPFSPPSASTPHRRFAGFAHVQWGNSLCLYLATDTEWDPGDGMFGFLGRLYLWLERGARGELDPFGGPLHPPVTYTVSDDVPSIVSRVDCPTVPEGGWFGGVRLHHVSERRVDIGGWLTIDEMIDVAGVGAAILLDQPLPFEYPRKVGELLHELTDRGVPERRILVTLQLAALQCGENAPMYVVVGTPMRGIRGSDALQQHLAVWRVDPVVVGGLRLSIEQYSSSPERREFGAKVEGLIRDWANAAPVDWCRVIEDRPEIVKHRDEDTPLAWFRDRNVAVWGCGALGGHVAQMLVRAGVRKLVLRDRGTVTPGVLSRQPFDDADIGESKAHVLAGRLRRIRPGVQIESHRSNVLNLLDGDDWADEVDVVIDATASNRVAEKLELRRRQPGVHPPALVSMVISQRARFGLAVVSLPGHSGGTRDVTRRAKIRALANENLGMLADAFWGPPPPVFQPEPGCSDATFVGSEADVAVLSGTMMNEIAKALSSDGGQSTASASFSDATGRMPAAVFSWLPDQIVQDTGSGYETRLAPEAWGEMRANMRQSARRFGSETETGGVLFGERDDVAKIVWVTEASGAPADSMASPGGFVCGVEGLRDLTEEKNERTRGSVRAVGLWHTHPGGVAAPSATDLMGMYQVVAAAEPSTPRSLMLIVGTAGGAPHVGAFVFSRRDTEKSNRRRSGPVLATELRETTERHGIGITLSGGGSRAIAFHLGCLRALHDRGILDQCQVLSAVSGGSVIAAMYAYSDDPFSEFDGRVVQLLKRGLANDIARQAFLSPATVPIFGTILTSGVAAAAADIARFCYAGLLRLQKWDPLHASRLQQIQPPWPRWRSRTTAFEEVLRRRLFGDRFLDAPRRRGIDVVLTACELRTGSAFRFGSRESGSWRFGYLASPAPVAKAVAASAAYPTLLPALDERMPFLEDGRVARHRVILVDGGVFDNLATSCMEPGRSPEFSTNVFTPEYIISCDAGAGLFDGAARPFWWPSRVQRSLEALFRKNQDATRGRLHALASTGQLRGFVHAYLGVRDERLPEQPSDLVPRGEVAGYPTDFSPMADRTIERLAKRGEQITRTLLARYCPEL